MNGVDAVQALLADTWSTVDLESMTSAGVRHLSRARGDWDPPEGIEPLLPLIHMAIGIPDSGMLPKERFAESAARVIARPGDSAFVYGFGMGYPHLREQLAERYTRDHGLAVDADWFQLTNGSSGAIDLICRTLVDPGDVIFTEAPTYMGTLRNFRGMQAEILPVPMDQEGLRVDLLAQQLRRVREEGRRVKFLYTISTYHNPTGVTLSLERRLALLRLAAEERMLILDDEAYSELWFERPPPASLLALSRGQGVIAVGTLSKILATGLRIGWIAAEPRLVKMMGNMRFAMGLNQLMVRVISDYMADGELDRHLERMRALYREKLERLMDALARHTGEFLRYQPPAGGFYLWASLAPGLSAEQVWRTSTHEGVSFSPGYSFFPARADDTGEHIRIAFAWTPIEDLEEGARRLGRACARIARGESA